MFNQLYKFRLLLVVGIALFAFVACGSSEEPAPDNTPSISFAEPTDGSTVSSPVMVKMEATNFTIEPAGEVREGTGHFHIMVDVECVTSGEIIPNTDNHKHFGGAQLETELELEPGEHTLCLQVGDGIHTALDIVDEITITVE